MLNKVLYGYRKCFCLKDNEIDLELTEHQSLLAKLVYPLSYIDVFYNYKRCIVVDETTFHR